MELSIIVVNWKSTDYLRACLASLYRHLHGVEFEVIVVDNASEDGCTEMIAASFPGVRLFMAAHNLGFARANNLGFAASRGRTLLFLNPDTEIRGDALQCMHAWLRTHPEAGAAGARLLNTDGSLQESCVQAFPTLLNQFLDSNLLRHWFPCCRLWGTRALLDPRPGAKPVEAISGACFMVKREVFEAAGHFTEEYFMYSDDLDLSYKIHRAGFQVVCLTGCEVLHHGGRSTIRQEAWFADVHRREATAQYFRRTRGPLVRTLYCDLMAVAALLRLAIMLVLFVLSFSASRRRHLRQTLQRWRKILAWSIIASGGVSMSMRRSQA